MYDAGYMRSFYDDYGEREWHRFETDAAARMNFLVHRHYLQRYVRPGNTVLEVGAGPGRFTIELARIGARVLVGDLSPVQLESNRVHVAEAGYEDGVLGRQVMDIADLSALDDNRFDVTVCYGGALSYMFERTEVAVDELLRVTRPGGYLLLSVMSLFGTLRRFLPALGYLIEQHGLDAALNDVLRTGNLSGEINNGHPMHLFRSAELAALLAARGADVIATAPANFLSPGNEAFLDGLVDDETLWAAFVGAEIDACSQPGTADGGTHIVAVAQRMG